MDSFLDDCGLKLHFVYTFEWKICGLELRFLDMLFLRLEFPFFGG